jgi:hypothetical protein
MDTINHFNHGNKKEVEAPKRLITIPGKCTDGAMTYSRYYS